LVAESAAIAKGWKLALEEKVAEAKAMKEEIHGSESFKETLEKLSKWNSPPPHFFHVKTKNT
jgi:hypothetical protein